MRHRSRRELLIPEIAHSSHSEFSWLRGLKSKRCIHCIGNRQRIQAAQRSEHSEAMAASPKDRPVGNPLRAAASDDYSTLDNEDSAGSAKRRRRSRWMLALAVISACCVGSALAVIFRKDVLRACYRIGRLPPVAGGLLFSALLALWLTCLLPTSLL